jgi:hypothetical protein
MTPTTLPAQAAASFSGSKERTSVAVRDDAEAASRGPRREPEPQSQSFRFKRGDGRLAGPEARGVPRGTRARACRPTAGAEEVPPALSPKTSGARASSSQALPERPSAPENGTQGRA